MNVAVTGKAKVRVEEQASGARARGLDRAVQLLECLHAAREPVRIGDLARRLNAPRSTTYEIVSRFVEAGILEIYDDEGRVFFGKSVHFYGLDYLARNDFTRRATEAVDHLAAEANETTQLCTLVGNKYTVLHMQTGAKMFRISADIGLKLPLPWTASGRLLVSHMEPSQIREFIPRGDFILPDGREIAFEAFCDEVRRARAENFFATSGLVDNFTRCLAVPVWGGDKIARAVLCFVIAIETGESEVAKLTRMLSAAAQNLARLS